MSTRTVMSILSWLPTFEEARIERYTRSITSHQDIANVDKVIINNGCDINGVSNVLGGIHNRIPIIHLGKNWYDIAGIFAAYKLALEYSYDYFIYSYDDFVWYDSHAIVDIQNYMDINEDVWCMRLPKYVYGDPYYNVTHTPKTTNPESVRHDVGVGGIPHSHDPIPQRVGSHQFYKSNWRPISRPTFWRTSAYTKLLQGTDFSAVPVMQVYEGYVYSLADQFAKSYKCAFINGGVCHTYPQDTSSRISLAINWSDIRVNVNEFYLDLFFHINNVWNMDFRSQYTIY